jgi:hypothetical protein
MPLREFASSPEVARLCRLVGCASLTHPTEGQVSAFGMMPLPRMLFRTGSYHLAVESSMMRRFQRRDVTPARRIGLDSAS